MAQVATGKTAADATGYAEKFETSHFMFHRWPVSDIAELVVEYNGGVAEFFVGAFEVERPAFDALITIW